MPPGPALIGAVAGLVLILGYMSQGQAGVEDMRVAFSPFFVAFSLTMGVAYGTLFAFSIHQIRAIRDLHARATTVDVYHPDPLYAFSPIAARTAIALILITFGWSAGEPTGRSDLLSLLNGLFVMALALLVFISPLWGAHRMLVHAKRRALGENASRFRSAAAEVHRQLDLGKTAGMDALNRAMATLDLERAHLARTPTWPWQPETLRGVLAAVALPIIVWLIQFGLQRWLG
jgi:hypothetical protein